MSVFVGMLYMQLNPAVVGICVLRRWGDWIKQSKAALAQAEDSLKQGHFWASCFFSHQAAEFSVKALLAYLGVEARGHSVSELLRKCSDMNVDFSKDLYRAALNLDRHYLQSRYVNTFYSGAPVDYYTEQDAARALQEASMIVRAVEEKIGELS
ncbi:MAG: HEPN domain-containing protein [Candidatus Caldarchaeum sp.]